MGKLLKDLFTFRKEIGLFLERLLHRRVFSTQMLELMGVRFPLRQLLHEALLRGSRVDSEPFCRAGGIHDRFYGTHLFFQYVSRRLTETRIKIEDAGGLRYTANLNISLPLIPTMSIHDIQNVLSLRKNIRDPKLSATVRSVVERIHHSMKHVGDSGGWKKVEWRSNNAGHGGGHGGHGGGGHGGGGGGGHGGYRDHRDTGRSGYGKPQARPMASVPSVAVPSVAVASVAVASVPSVAAEPRRPEHRGPPPKYVSKFKKASDNVDETILNTILLGKLNKFSESNYPEIKEFITHIISSGQTDMITCFMKVVFEKAAAEEIFCPLYAKLLSELSASYPVLLTEMATLYAQYMEIFEEVVETSATSYNEVCKRNVEKKYRRGYSQFLAELTRHHVIPTETFMKVVETILRQVEVNAPLKEATKLNEELADCLMKIVKAIRNANNANNADETTDRIRTMLTQEALLRIQPLTLRDPVMEGISNKSRFTFMDIHDAIQKL